MRLELFLKLCWMVVLAWNVSVALFALVMRLGGRFWQNNTSTFLRGKSYLCALYLPFSALIELILLSLLFALGRGRACQCRRADCASPALPTLAEEKPPPSRGARRPDSRKRGIANGGRGFPAPQ